MCLLKQLKKIPKEKQHLPIYHDSINDLSTIKGMSSEIISFYDKDQDKKYQCIFFHYETSSLFSDLKDELMTVSQVIEILELMIDDSVMDIRFFYLPFYDFIDSVDELKFKEKDGNEGYVIT